MPPEPIEPSPDEISPKDDNGAPAPFPDPENLIPIEQSIQETKTPEPYIVKIRVTPEQQANIKLIESTLKTDQPVQLPYGQTRDGLQRLFRIVVALILLSLSLWAALWSGPPFPYPAIQPETRNLYQNLQTIQPNAAVLVAIDYGPSFIPELDPAAVAVLSDLFARQVFIAFVTTNTSGVIQIDRIVSQIENDLSISLFTPADYVNLGYVPGGTAGLNSLVNSIRSTYPGDLSGDQIWTNSPLQGINSVSEFNSLIILVDNAENGRAWIEQVGSQLSQTPFYLITSAQAGPILRAYYQGEQNQIQGLLSGLTDIVTLENITGRSDSARNIWNGYSLTVTATAVLILVGGLVGLIMASTKNIT